MPGQGRVREPGPFQAPAASINVGSDMLTYDDTLSLRERAERLQSAGVFLGGPLRKFETVGRNQLSILLRNGLNLDSKVLDVGCGCLRAGYWIMQFLQPGCYCGIEPNRDMLEAGKAVIVGPDVLDAKQPRFSNNADFDFEVFGERFDFVIARSIWTHASPGQIETMLDQFVKTRTPDGVLLASIKECPWYRRQYAGDAWVGKSDTSEEGGIVRYRFRWIRRICADRGLNATRLQNEHGQVWVRIG